MTIDKDQIIQNLDYFFSILRDRWENGLKLFNKKINDYKDISLKNNFKQKDIINTPIHNIITIDEDFIFLLLDSIFMQRLRGIHHQGLAYLVYPTANHFRFDHSLGTYKLVKDIINSLKARESCSNYKNCEFNDNELKIAALLHDIGHYPFSHIGEKIFNDFLKTPVLTDIVDLKKDIYKWCKIETHESRTVKIIMGEDIITGLREEYQSDIGSINPFKLFIDGVNSYINEKDHQIDIKNIGRLIIGRNKKDEEFGHLINGPLDVDKIDYILREAYFTGTPFGNIDLHRMIEGYLIGNVKKNDKEYNNCLVLNKRMIPSILQLYIARQFNYLTISFHRTVRIAETMFKIIFDLIMQDFLINFKSSTIFEKIFKDILFHFKLMEDRDFLHFLEIFTQISPKAKYLFNKLISRMIYKNFIVDEPIPYNKKMERRKINDYLKLYLPVEFLIFNQENINQNLFNTNIDTIISFYNGLSSTNKDNFKKLSDYAKEFKDEFMILNTILYPLSEKKIEDEINKHMDGIFIYDEKNPNMSMTLLSDPIGKKLSNFLGGIFNINSTVIIATEQNLAQIIKKSEIFENFNFLEEFIYLFILYNEKKILINKI